MNDAAHRSQTGGPRRPDRAGLGPFFHLDGLWDKADRYRRLGLEVVRSQAERDQKAHEHQALIDCVVAGDTEGAAEIMRRHIDTSLGAKAARRLGAQPVTVPEA